MNQPRPEYPRPQFVRNEWINLNGVWNFSFDDENLGMNNKWYKDHTYEQEITVPFSYQSELSGIGNTDFHDIVWYERTFTIPSDWNDKRIILHFGAVDYRAQVWVNGELVATHEGGHVPFKADISHVIKAENKVVVRAEDPSKELDQPRGKQYWKEKSESIFYTRTTGIWQTVWLEAVNESYLEKVKFTPNIDTDEVVVDYVVNGGTAEQQLEIEISFDGELVAKDAVHLGSNSGSRQIYLSDFNVHGPGRLWSPEHPNLYDIVLRVKENDHTVDEVTSYFGMRKVSIVEGKFLLNNRPYYQKLILDQGYFPKGILTPPSDEDLKKDVELTKEMGFNGARKHQKVEDPRYLYWADKLGLLVWGEMANSYTYTNESVERITKEWQEVIERDYSHPSIVAWVPLNESWGVPRLLSDDRQVAHSLSLYYLTKSLDSTRPVISNDGWEHTKSDLLTIHDYESKKEVLTERYSTVESTISAMPAGRFILTPGFSYQDEPILVSEFGGIAYKKSDWEGWGYSGADSDEDFADRYNAVVSAMLESPTVQGFCYTQLTDVEQEINGLLTYDREPKIPLETIRAINEGKTYKIEKVEAK
ncbi:glycoside hydrolase family 2 protein [Lederbergia citrea]|uniref:Glycoside hydrolase family 2 n=1 Tax=Lederbergia citrea TaxID=2833581 RepID=A0A942Z6V8_9BACI|nr:sugar-binding domain-containing protein [Lederbergia citrea]MBS4206185.1 glycoside hydrolase family 2 [Lederbergia citrea]MBS4224880.1 glycoside hydrolase family 2 [Lederbergia citrea]